MVLRARCGPVVIGKCAAEALGCTQHAVLCFREAFEGFAFGRERERAASVLVPYFTLCFLQFGFKMLRAAFSILGSRLPWVHVTCCPPQLSGAHERAVLGVKPLHHSPGERKRERGEREKERERESFLFETGGVGKSPKATPHSRLENGGLLLGGGGGWANHNKQIPVLKPKMGVCFRSKGTERDREKVFF